MNLASTMSRATQLQLENNSLKSQNATLLAQVKHYKSMLEKRKTSQSPQHSPETNVVGVSCKEDDFDSSMSPPGGRASQPPVVFFSEADDVDSFRWAISALQRENNLLREQLDDYVANFINPQLKNVSVDKSAPDTSTSALASTLKVGDADPMNWIPRDYADPQQQDREIQNLKVEVLQLREENDALQNEIMQARAFLTKCESERTIMNGVVDQTQEKFQQLTKNLQDALAVITELRDEKDTLVKEVAFLCESLSTANGTSGTMQSNERSEEVAQVWGRLQKMAGMLQEIRGQFETQISAANEKYEECQRQLTATLKQNKALHAKITELQGSQKGEGVVEPTATTNNYFVEFYSQEEKDRLNQQLPHASSDRAQSPNNDSLLNPVNLWSQLTSQLAPILRFVLSSDEGTGTVREKSTSRARLSDTFTARSADDSEALLTEVSGLRMALLHESCARSRSLTNLYSLRETHMDLTRSIQTNPILNESEQVSQLRQQNACEVQARMSVEAELEIVCEERDRLCAAIDSGTGYTEQLDQLQARLIEEIQLRTKAELALAEGNRASLSKEFKGCKVAEENSAENVNARARAERQLQLALTDRDHMVRSLTIARQGDTERTSILQKQLLEEIQARAKAELHALQAQTDADEAKKNLLAMSAVSPSEENKASLRVSILETQLLREIKRRSNTEEALERARSENERYLRAMTAAPLSETVQMSILVQQLLEATATKAALEQELHAVRTELDRSTQSQAHEPRDQALILQLNSERLQMAQSMDILQGRLSTMTRERDMLLLNQETTKDVPTILSLHDQLLEALHSKANTEAALVGALQGNEDAVKTLLSKTQHNATETQLRQDLLREVSLRIRMEASLQSMREERDRLSKTLRSEDGSAELVTFLREQLLNETQACVRAMTELEQQRQANARLMQIVQRDEVQSEPEYLSTVRELMLGELDARLRAEHALQEVRIDRDILSQALMVVKVDEPAQLKAVRDCLAQETAKRTKLEKAVLCLTAERDQVQATHIADSATADDARIPYKIQVMPYRMLIQDPWVDLARSPQAMKEMTQLKEELNLTRQKLKLMMDEMHEGRNILVDLISKDC